MDAPAACAVPFRPYSGGVVTRTRNVSEYMLVAHPGQWRPAGPHSCTSLYAGSKIPTPCSFNAVNRWSFYCYISHESKCIVVTRVCVCVCLSAALFSHYCTDPNVTWRNGRGCPLVVHYWADLQSVHGWCCYDNIARTRNVSECLYSLYDWLLIVTYCKSHLKTTRTLLWPVNC